MQKHNAAVLTEAALKPEVTPGVRKVRDHSKIEGSLGFEINDFGETGDGKDI
jgi:hypothetical protein